MAWAWPAFIAPLFNRFSPLADQTLRTRIEALLRRCGFTSRGVFVVDNSRRSTHGNAYFTGIGRNKRIVFFDTLLERLGQAEIEAVLAHELGHFRLHHVRQRLLVSVASAFAGLAALGWLAARPQFYAALGVPVPSTHAALLLFVLAVPAFTYFLTPLAALWSRRHEFEADAFATRARRRHRARHRAGQAASGQRHDPHARPAVRGVLLLAPAAAHPHRAAARRPGERLTAASGDEVQIDGLADALQRPVRGQPPVVAGVAGARQLRHGDPA